MIVRFGPRHRHVSYGRHHAGPDRQQDGASRLERAVLGDPDLLGSQLTDKEVHEIGEELASQPDPDSAGAIREAITAVTHQQANDADVARARSRLAAGGWPLAKLQLAD